MNLIIYIINENASGFFSRSINHLNKEKVIYSDDSYVEFKLFDESLSLHLSAKLTLIKVAIKYGSFIMNSDIHKRVKKFENSLFELIALNSKTVYRIDESLVDEYTNLIGNEIWYESTEAFNDFSHWVASKETLHWEKIELN